ncbi:MAG: diguanylate cyclase [Lachnospiraceae bacterium]|nr:diguanylate cyclase [Lachnospiraceae bacterium]
MNLNKKKSYLLYIMVVFVIVIIGIFAALIPTENLRIGRGRVYDLNSGWRIEYQGVVMNDVSLPTKIEVAPGEMYLASYVFEEELPESTTLRVRSSMQSIRLTLDGEEIFTTGKPADGTLHSPEASVWYFIPLPSGVKGKTLTMEISSTMEGFSGIVNPVYYGESQALHFDLFKTNRVGFLSSVIILLLGILSIIMSFFLFNMGDNRLFYLGLFAVTVSIWIMAEAKLLQFFTGNRFVLGGISYMMVALMPIPLYLYIRDAVITKKKKLVTGFAVILFLDFLANIILQVTGIVGFLPSLSVTNGIILLTAAVVVYLLFQEVHRDNNTEAKHFLLKLSLFLVLTVFEIIQFFSQNYEDISKYSRVGIIVFYCLLIYDTIHYIDELIVKENEAKFYHKLAFKDILTGSDNRTSFNKDLEELLYGKDKKAFRLMLLDINNLKMINDQFGHQEGDRAIIKCYQSLSDAFHKLGRCYRLGGDEYACIMKNTDSKTYEQAYHLFGEQLKQESMRLPYSLEIAAGSAIYTHECNYNDFYNRVDQLMYEDKRNKKRCQAP